MRGLCIEVFAITHTGAHIKSRQVLKEAGFPNLDNV